MKPQPRRAGHPGRRRHPLAVAALLAALAAPTACAAPGEAPPAHEAPAPSQSLPAAPSPAGADTIPVDSVPLHSTVPEQAAGIAPPVRIQVEGTGIDLAVIPVGVEDNGAMTLPDNHHQAGWYRYGPAPGAAAGSAVLAAHVDSRTEELPIAGLDEVPAGTILTVTRGDGSILRYAAEGVESIAKTSLDGQQLFDRTGEPRLKLVTCGGRWLDASDDYEDNVVLTAVPLS